jgi:hypothetical protein
MTITNLYPRAAAWARDGTGRQARRRLSLGAARLEGEPRVRGVLQKYCRTDPNDWLRDASIDITGNGRHNMPGIYLLLSSIYT